MTPSGTCASLLSAPQRGISQHRTPRNSIRGCGSAYRAYIEHAAQTELPLNEDAVDDGILADLIAGLHHYADSQGIDFENAVASGQAVYDRHRASEDNRYRIGDEVHLRQRRDTTVPSRGVVVSIFPERDGEPTYHVRFPGQADAIPLRGREIGSAASFPVVTTNQGIAASLAAAERLLIETAARIRASEQRQVPPHDHDLADKDSLLLAIGNACALAGSDVLRHLEPQVAAWTDVITQPWHPVHVTAATELAALDFPQPVQASVLADPWSADTGARQDTPHQARPCMLPGTGPGPFIETDAHGYAIVASASDEAGLSVTSAQVQEATAESLDGSSATVKNPGNLADLRDEAYFSGKLPAGSTDTDKRSASGRVFALKTAGGGVLVFYALAAQLTLAPPPGQTFQVGIPGFYSSSQTLTSATVGYAEQFATYIPPDQASPQILADASGITGRG